MPVVADPQPSESQVPRRPTSRTAEHGTATKELRSDSAHTSTEAPRGARGNWLRAVKRDALLAPLQENAADLKPVLSVATLRSLEKSLERGTGARGESVTELRVAFQQLAQSADSRAAQLMIPLLDAESQLVTQLAIQSLGELRDPAATLPLLKKLDQVSESFRAEIYVALGRIGDARWTDSLMKRAQSYPDHAIACEQVLVDCGAPALPRVVAYLSHEDPLLVIRAVSILSRSKRKSVASRLLPLLQHPHAPVREAVLRALTQIGERGTADAISPLLEDLNETVRLSAATALGSLGSPAQTPQLVASLKRGPVEFQERVVFALGELRCRDAAPALQTLFETAASRLRKAIVEALGKIKDPRSLKTLLKATHGSDELIRERAVFALRFYRTPDVQARLAELLEDLNSAVRARAIEGLCETDPTPLLDQFLKQLASETNPAVRKALLGALGKIKSPRTIPILEDLLHDPHEIPVDAITALGEIGDAAALPALLAMLKDNRAMVRYHATQALGRLGHANAVSPLQELLADQDPLVRTGAAKALIKLGDPRQEQLLVLAAQAPRAARGSLLQFLHGELPMRKVVFAGLVAFTVLVSVGLSVRAMMEVRDRAIPRGRVNSLAISPDGKMIAVGRNTSGLIEFWDAESGSLLKRAQLAEGAIDGLAVGPNGTVLAFSAKVGQFIDSGTPRDVPGHPNGLFRVIGPLENGQVVSVGQDGSVYFWDLTRGEAVKTSRIPGTALASVAISRDGHRIASATANGEVTVIEGHPPVEVGKFKVDGRPMAMAFTPDAKRLLISLPGQGLSVVDPEGKEPPELLAQAESRPTYAHLRFLPDGKLLAIEGGRADLWDLETQTAHPVEGLAGKIDFVAVSADGINLVIGDREESLVRLLDRTTKSTREFDAP